MDNSILVEQRQWADDPYPLIKTPKYIEGEIGYTNPYMETASTIIVIQAPNIQAADYKDFIGYSFCWYSAIHDHHTSEEDQFFPEIEASVGEKSLLDGNIQQHRFFQAGFDEFSSYLEGLAGKESTFDAIHLNSIISTFATALCHHLASEIQSLQDLSKYGVKLQIEELWSREGKRTVVFPDSQPFKIMPTNCTKLQ